MLLNKASRIYEDVFMFHMEHNRIFIKKSKPHTNGLHVFEAEMKPGQIHEPINIRCWIRLECRAN